MHVSVSASSNPLNQTKAQSLLPWFAPPTKHAPFSIFSYLSFCTTQQRQEDCGAQSLLSSLPATICSMLIRRCNSSKTSLCQKSCIASLQIYSQLWNFTRKWRARDLDEASPCPITIYLDGAGNVNCGLWAVTMELEIPIWSASASLGMATTFWILECT